MEGIAQAARPPSIHKTTSSLVKGDSQTLVIEDLNVSGMLKNRKLSQAVADVSFSEFSRQLKYKCDWYGKNLITIGMFEPSSKMCSVCGTINKTLALADREWLCASCGVVHDRDFNAAKNIKQIGLEKYSGEGIPGGPVELRRLRRAKKQECITTKILKIDTPQN
jgi:putative transposase